MLYPLRGCVALQNISPPLKKEALPLAPRSLTLVPPGILLSLGPYASSSMSVMLSRAQVKGGAVPGVQAVLGSALLSPLKAAVNSDSFTGPAGSM